MSTKDSAGDKLVATIRKTRSGATERSNQAREDSKSPGVRKTTAKRSAPRKTAASRAVNPGKHLIDAFQSGKRVWPD